MTTPPTEQQLDEITAYTNAATSGPWTVELEQCDCSDGLCGHGTYVSAVYAGGERRTDFVEFPDSDWQFIIRARTAVPALLAEVRRARDRVAELEAFAYGCDAEGCVLPHSSWCEAAKKTAAANDGCTCGKPWTGHPQPHAMHCWTVNPPRAEVEEMRKRIAELTAEASTGKATPAPPVAPLAASQPPEAPTEPETATEAPEGPLRDPSPTIPPRRTLTPNEYSAAWHAIEGTAGEEGADPGTVLHAVLNRLGIDTPGAEELPAAEDPAPAEDFTGTQPCGHDDYHDPHPWHERPNLWCPGIGYADDQAAADTTGHGR